METTGQGGVNDGHAGRQMKFPKELIRKASVRKESSSGTREMRGIGKRRR